MINTTNIFTPKASLQQQLAFLRSEDGPQLFREWQTTFEKQPRGAVSSDDAFDVWLHGIVGDEFTETDSLSIGKLFAEYQGSGKLARLRVNSPGGLAYDGVAIFNIIDAYDGPSESVVEGLAGSAASLAAIACDTVKCHSAGVYHPHKSIVMAIGHEADIREALAIQVQLDEDMAQVYKTASGQSLPKVKKDLLGPNGDGTRFSAQEAKAAGYVDEVIKHNKQKPPGANLEEPEATTDNRLKVHKKRLAMIY